MRTSVIWFRNDLRLHDNITLHQAINNSDRVIPVYIFDDRHYRLSSFGFPKTGAFRTQFIIESVTDLRQNLHKLGAKLLVRRGQTEQVLAEICARYNAYAVYYSREVAPYEKIEEAAVANAVANTGAECFGVFNDTLVLRSELPFAISSMPDMFTAFRWQVEKRDILGKPLPIPRSLTVPPGLEEGEIPTCADLTGTLPLTDHRASTIFKGGESNALARLDHYTWGTDAIATYFDTRNGLLGNNFASKLSPWLAAGCISPRHINAEVKRYEAARAKNKSTYWLIFELLWRDFFRLNMHKHQTQLFFPGGIKRKVIKHSNNDERFNAWKDATTGNAFIDANMNELKYTGFMSNRGRQVVASYLVNDLNQNWLRGAAYFESMLIDYDVCSNYGNWAYIAGVGNDPRNDRYFDVNKQANTYDPDGRYRRHWANPLHS